MKKEMIYLLNRGELYHELTANHGYDLKAAGVIAGLDEKNNFLQILYTYGISAVRTLLAIYEEIEYYEKCVFIHKAVEDFNKSTGKSYKTK